MQYLSDEYCIMPGSHFVVHFSPFLAAWVSASLRACVEKKRKEKLSKNISLYTKKINYFVWNSLSCLFLWFLSPLLCVLVCFSSSFIGQFCRKKNPSSFSWSFLLYHRTGVLLFCPSRCKRQQVPVFCRCYFKSNHFSWMRIIIGLS